MSLIPERWRWIVAACGVLSSGPVLASSVTVPDEFPSIQAAIDYGADTVSVREGIYPEIPRAYRGVVLQGLGSRRPRLGGLAISNPYGWGRRPWSIHGIDFTGPVTLWTDWPGPRLLRMSFTDCALDSGLKTLWSGDPYDIDLLAFTNCRLSGGSDARAASILMDADTVDAGVQWNSSESLTIRKSWFRGGPGRALEILGDALAGVVDSCLFEDYNAGIRATDLDGFTMTSNVIRRVTGTGLDASGYGLVITDNRLTSCGIGIRCGGEAVKLYDNTLIGMRQNGVQVDGVDRLDMQRNVVGRCGGTGISVRSGYGGSLMFQGTTLYDNAGSGIHLGSSAVENTVLVRNNIVSGNTGWGLLIEVPQLNVTLGCNDWFRNGLGAVHGAPGSPEDLHVDPLFCDAANDDLTLYADSPLLTQLACGRIGARDEGCAAPELARMSVTPEAERIIVRWAFGSSDTTQGWVEKAVQSSGPWVSLGGGTRVEAEGYALIDTDVTPDEIYRYRVAWAPRGRILRSAPATGQLVVEGPSRPVSPNPARGGVEIAWTLSEPGDVEIRVYDLVGREVATVTKGRYPAGRHHVRWDGRAAGGGTAPAGWYAVRVARGRDIASHGVLLLR